MSARNLTYRPAVSAAPPAATHTLYPNPCTLTPNPYSLKFPFSAKERDTETGLSYFGARYYSSDLSVWLSVDPMSDKYPSLSPYTYCADNPVKLVDPNGEEIVISETTDEVGNRVVNIKFTATLVDHTNDRLSADYYCSYEDLQKYRDDIVQGIKEVYGGIMNDGTIVNIDVDMDICPRGQLINPESTRHVIEIVRNLPDGQVGEAEVGGGKARIDFYSCNSKARTPLKWTAAHEFGHFLGLEHVDTDEHNGNIMTKENTGYCMTGAQINEACRNYRNGSLNKNIQGYETRRILWRNYR